MRARVRMVGALGALGALALLCGCGESGQKFGLPEVPGSPSSPSSPADPGTPAAPPVLTDAQLGSALLPAEALGDGFVEGGSSNLDINDRPPGCLDAFSLGSVPAYPVRIGRQGISPVAPSGPTALVLLEEVGTFASSADAARTVPLIRDAFSGCAEVDETDGGTRMRLSAETDDRPSPDGADEAVRARAEGTMTAGDRAVPMQVWLTAVRVDNHVVITTVIGLAPEVGPTVSDQVLGAAVERLRAVVDGTPLPRGPQVGGDTV